MILLDHLYSIVPSAENETEVTDVNYRIELHREDVIFQAHFPGEPILPGACIVQIVQELTSLWRHRELSLVKVNNLKFLSIISPDALSQLQVSIHLTKEEGQTVQVKGSLHEADTEYSKFSLTFE